MLSYPEYVKLDGIALAQGIRNKDFTAAEVTACAIDRARQINPGINAIVHENYDKALSRAARLDENPGLLQQSKVAGLPFLIKDLNEAAGMPVSFGSRLYKDHVASENSKLVARYLDAGLIVLGKTNTPEFGLTLTTESQASGPCRNPWNLDYSSGGSSGGAAAAVAAGIVPVAHASDGGGSIRIPASCCGLFGLKPSRGLTTIGNKLGESWSGMSIGHVLSRSVRDSAAFLDIIKLQAAHLYPLPDSPSSFYDSLNKDRDSARNRKLKIAVQTSHPDGEAVDQDCVLAVQRAARLCESLGHHVEDFTHPVDHAAAGKAMSILINVHVNQAVARRAEELQLSLDDCPLETSTRIIARRGAGISAADYLCARDSLAAIAQEMAVLHQSHDVIIQPVLSKTPARLGWLDMNSSDMKSYTNRFKAYSGFTALANGTGQPSMSVPLHLSTDRIPLGVLFTAAWGNDMLLLQLAADLEKSAPWPGVAQVS